MEPTAITHLERKMIFQTSIIMVHVNLQLVYDGSEVPPSFCYLDESNESKGATIRDPAARPGDPNGARLRRGRGFSPSYLSNEKKGPLVFFWVFGWGYMLLPMYVGDYVYMHNRPLFWIPMKQPV